jgi:glycosyltransferase involved in cell wall biosynthesis
VELTILMPCLNEARTVQQCVQEALGFLEREGVDGEVLVADNGSTDGSQALAQAAGARVIDVPRRGYGAALIAGIGAARGDFVIMGDADQSYDFSSLQGYLAGLRSGAQLVMGNRFKGGIDAGAMPVLHRHLGNPVLSFLGRLFFRTHIGDFHCGLRGFHRQSIDQLRLVSPGMEFASEMIAKAALAGLRIEEVPTRLRPDGRGRPPHLRTWRDGWRHLRFLLLFCPRWLFLYPGLALLAGGLVGFLALQPTGPAPRVHSLLYMAAAVILGVQLLQLAVLTKWFGVSSGIVPAPAWLQRSKPLRTVETGLLAGGVMFIVGLLWSLAIVLDWGATGFGAVDPAFGMQVVIPAVALMIVGMQAMAGALFAGAAEICWRSVSGAPDA